MPVLRDSSKGRRRSLLLASLLLSISPAFSAQAQLSDLVQPKQHLTIERPGRLGDAEAIALYQNIRERVHGGYRLAAHAAVADLCDWPLYNRAPYLSATHGRRYVNNYANPLARAYGRYEQAGPMPVGAVLAKDSFTVTRQGEVFAGALFVMEKMPAGFNPAGSDWRYTMIMPDGSLFGTTKGEGSDRVDFCITCHQAVPAEHHQLFFVPPAYRIERLTPP
jgi:hypothetical protein